MLQPAGSRPENFAPLLASPYTRVLALTYWRPRYCRRPRRRTLNTANSIWWHRNMQS